jgi:hypothetical protein
MTERTEKYLYDILYAIECIEILIGEPKIFVNYRADYQDKKYSRKAV